MHIIITGASRGIGLETVKALLENPDHKILALSRNIRPLEDLNAGSRLQYRVLDLEKPHSQSDLLPILEKEFAGKVDILINNAGLLIKKPFAEFEPEDFDRIFSVNVKGVVFLIQQLLPFFSSGSHIVNIGSMGGIQGSVKFEGLSLYAASKGALSVLTECLAEEFNPRGIAVNALALGAVETEMMRQAFPAYSTSMTAKIMGTYIADFALNGHRVYNGKVLPVSSTTP